MIESSLYDVTEPNSYDKIYFLHIPKCAGMGVRDILIKHYAPRPVLEVNATDDPRAMYPDKYEEAPAYYGHAFIDTIGGGSFMFTFLRHPLRRLLSLYNYIVQLQGEGRDHYKALGFKMDMTPVTFAQTATFANIDNGMVRQLAGVPFLYETEYEPVTSFHLKMAQDALHEFDFVGFVETFESDFRRLGPELGIELPSYLPVTNRSKQVAMLTPLVSRELGKRNQLDVRLYEYASRHFTS